MARVGFGPAAALTIIGAMMMAASLRAATITVNSTADNTIAGDAQCTLREAIANVNATGDTTNGDCSPATGANDTIVFNLPVSSTITLTSNTELSIRKDVTITGQGPGTLAIDGNKQAPRVFEIIAGTVSIAGLTIQNGAGCAEGGCPGAGVLVSSAATVTMTSCTLVGNRAAGCCFDDGGAIANRGTLTLVKSDLRDNYAFGGGGAIDNTGALTAADCNMSNNRTGGGAGAILNNGTLTLVNSILSGNYGEGFGGAIGNGGTLTMANSTLSSNTGEDDGGAIYNDGIATIRDSTLRDNTVQCSACGGGGITNSGTLILTNCTLSGNNGPAGGGGVTNGGTLSLTNCTLTGNSSESEGAVANGGVMTVTNCTVSDNSGYPAAIGNGYYGTVMIRNTIIASSGTDRNCAGSLIDGGHNLQWPSTDASCVGNFGDPRLAPLADNGGPTQTMALLPGSAAIGAGDNAICFAPLVSYQDQRGFLRHGIGGDTTKCSIGAYEFDAGVWCGPHEPVCYPAESCINGACSSATPTPSPSLCVGDCDGNGTVEINEIITCVNIALGAAQLSTCAACDANGDGQVEINEIVQATHHTLDLDCPAT